jgi:hypothetical protein
LNILSKEIQKWIKEKSNSIEIYEFIDGINHPQLNTMKGKIARMFNKLFSEKKIQLNLSVKKSGTSKKEHKKEQKLESDKKMTKSQIKKHQKKHEDKVSREIRKKVGDLFEKNMIKTLVDDGIPRDSFLTEDFMNSENEAAAKAFKMPKYDRTPDFLFKKPVDINGHFVIWIDCKNCVILKELMSEFSYKEYLTQINDYCRHYGPGLIVFHRPYFDRKEYEFPDMVEHVTMISPNMYVD